MRIMFQKSELYFLLNVSCSSDHFVFKRITLKLFNCFAKYLFKKWNSKKSTVDSCDSNITTATRKISKLQGETVKT